MQFIEIQNYNFPIFDYDPKFSDLIPSVNPSFHWTDSALEILHDLYPHASVNNPQSILIDHKAKRNTLLAGHTGTGKTEIIRQICALLRQPLLRLNCNGGLLITDFLGNLQVKTNNQGSYTEFAYGALPTAMKNGLFLLIDEIDYADPEILGGLNSVLENDSTLMLKEAGQEVICAHPWFRVAATANSVGLMESYRDLYLGTKALNSAFLNRWDVYEITYLDPVSEEKIVKEAIPALRSSGFREELVKRFVQVANEIRTGFLNHDLPIPMSTRELLAWIDKSIRTQNPLRAIDSILLNKIGDCASRQAVKDIVVKVTGINPDLSHQGPKENYDGHF